MLHIADFTGATILKPSVWVRHSRVGYSPKNKKGQFRIRRFDNEITVRKNFKESVVTNQSLLRKLLSAVPPISDSSIITPVGSLKREIYGIQLT